MKFKAILLAVCVAACGQSAEKGPEVPTGPAGPDPATLNIEIGRYSAMLYQIDELTAERPGSASEESEQRDFARRLRENVWRLNLERSQLCAKGLFADITCAGAYEPVWISEPATAEPTLEELQTRSDALGDEVMRFWDAVCEDARSRASEEDRATVCGME